LLLLRQWRTFVGVASLVNQLTMQTNQYDNNSPRKQSPLRMRLVVPTPQLALPLFADPRRMNRAELLREIERLGGDVNSLSKEPKVILVAYVFKLLVEYGKKNPIDPMLMHDEQTEKWYVLAEMLHIEICIDEEDPTARSRLISDATTMLQDKTIQELVQIANNQSCQIQEKVLRFVACLMLEPHFEQIAESKVARIGSIRASVTIAGNVYGFTGVPNHLSVEAAKEMVQEKSKRVSRKRSKSTIISTIEGDTEVIIGEELSIEVGTRSVRARVTGINEKVDDDERIDFDVIAVPLNIQDLGPNFEFKLTTAEYNETRNEMIPDIDDIVI
jgi:hypothetical protein